MMSTRTCGSWVSPPRNAAGAGGEQRKGSSGALAARDRGTRSSPRRLESGGAGLDLSCLPAQHQGGSLGPSWPMPVPSDLRFHTRANGNTLADFSASAARAILAGAELASHRPGSGSASASTAPSSGLVRGRGRSEPCARTFRVPNSVYSFLRRPANKATSLMKKAKRTSFLTTTCCHRVGFFAAMLVGLAVSATAQELRITDFSWTDGPCTSVWNYSVCPPASAQPPYTVISTTAGLCYPAGYCPTVLDEVTVNINLPTSPLNSIYSQWKMEVDQVANLPEGTFWVDFGTWMSPSVGQGTNRGTGRVRLQAFPGHPDGSDSAGVFGLEVRVRATVQARTYGSGGAVTTMKVFDSSNNQLQSQTASAFGGGNQARAIDISHFLPFGDFLDIEFTGDCSSGTSSFNWGTAEILNGTIEAVVGKLEFVDPHLPAELAPTVWRRRSPEGSEYALTPSVVPEEVRVRHTINGLPGGAARLRVTLSSEDDGAGHDHNAGSDRLAGWLYSDLSQLNSSQIKAARDPGGNFPETPLIVETDFITGIASFIYLPPEFSGRETIHIEVVDFGPVRPLEHETEVRVPNLQPLAPSPSGFYALKPVQPGSFHSANHYGTSTACTGLMNAAALYRQYQQGDSQLLQIRASLLALGQPQPWDILVVTEMSLPKGGLFDQERNWAAPHGGHREGRNIDLQTKHLGPITPSGDLLQRPSRRGTAPLAEALSQYKARLWLLMKQATRDSGATLYFGHADHLHITY